MKIRPAKQEDLETVRELWEALYLECPEPDHERKDWEDIAGDVRRGIDEHVALLAEDGGEAVGFLLSHIRSPRIGYVSDLYVRPAQRRRGLAKALVSEAARRLECEIVTLDVDASNGSALAFYERIGFHRQSARLAAAAKVLT